MKPLAWFDACSDWILAVLLFSSGALIVFIILAEAYQFFNPPKYYNLPRNEWQCSKTETIMVGKVIENRCVIMARKYAY